MCVPALGALERAAQGRGVHVRPTRAARPGLRRGPQGVGEPGTAALERTDGAAKVTGRGAEQTGARFDSSRGRGQRPHLSGPPLQAGALDRTPPLARDG